MDQHRKHRSCVDAPEPENYRLKNELFEFKQLAANLAKLVLIHAAATRHGLEAQRVEQRLETMQLVFSAIRDMVVVIDSGEKVLTANPITAEILGYDPTGFPLERLLADFNLRRRSGSPVATDASPLKQALAGHTIFNQEYQITDGRGLEHAVVFYAAPLSGESRVIGSVAVIRDESEHETMLRRVQLKRAALQAIIDHAPEGIVVVDRQGRMTVANPMAEHLFGRPIPKGVPVNTQVQNGFCYPNGHSYRAEDLPLSRSVLYGETITDRELMVRRPDGTKHFLLADASPIKDDQGHINGAVGIFRDVTRFSKDRMQLSADREDLRRQVNVRTAELQATIRALESQMAERRQMEKELIQSKKQLQRLSRHTLETLENDRKKMAKELHDSIGASLSAIKFIVEEKQARIEKNGADEHLSLEPIIHHLTNTIKETKSISAQLRPSTLDDLGLHSTLSWYCREFAAFHENIRIEHRIDVSETYIPEDYKIVLYRIVQEAMTNAAKHGRPSLIRCIIDQQKEYLRLTVHDNGCGFDPRKVLSSRDPLKGYGLQNMRERTEICGGTFKIDSQAGLGTRIRVLLWLQRDGTQL